MVRAVLRDGLFYPLDPIPADWVPGQQLRVEEFGSEPGSPTELEDLNQWVQGLEHATSQLDDAQAWAMIEQELAEANRQSKEYVRREMGLP